MAETWTMSLENAKITDAFDHEGPLALPEEDYQLRRFGAPSQISYALPAQHAERWTMISCTFNS